MVSIFRIGKLFDALRDRTESLSTRTTELTAAQASLSGRFDDATSRLAEDLTAITLTIEAWISQDTARAERYVLEFAQLEERLSSLETRLAEQIERSESEATRISALAESSSQRLDRYGADIARLERQSAIDHREMRETSTALAETILKYRTRPDERPA